ncbi:hypothetical protein [Aliikangiella sp. G2MR2-5]|uniref:hypothetical protein n=1 Tax=Aliikangiella sp. G2MR2-5 TaxID=2788943 RepID=UPI0018AC3936|nr:hypothetical protein [Aliikangiella sp. G2MR2-5]
MDKLTQFYLSLSQDAEKLAAFNNGQSQKEIEVNRKAMLRHAGISDIDDVASLSQDKLLSRIGDSLVDESSQWENVRSASVPNSNNTDNNVSYFGLGS